MSDSESYNRHQEIILSAKHIVVIQADNPDADSLASALALEELLSLAGKQVSVFCRVDMPGYLHYLSGWDRVSSVLPSHYDAAILVDASATSLLDMLQDPHVRGVLASKPFIIFDHHETVLDQVDFATSIINDSTVSSTGELLYNFAKHYNYNISVPAGTYMMAAILGDTQGLTNDLAKASTYQVMSELVALGVSRSSLEESRREYFRMPDIIFRYKADLIKRTEFFADGAVAVVSVPQSEINAYSPLYNPSALVQFDMLQVIGVQITIVFKIYDSGRVSAAIRANQSAPIAGRLAERMGGGGHAYASGFKQNNGRPFNKIKTECIKFAHELLVESNTGHGNENS